jgi:IPT/TIG domain
MSRVRSAVCAVYTVLSLLAFAGGAGCSEKEGLRVTGIEPKTGSHNGSTQVTIHGSGFQQDGAKGVKVYFGNSEARVIGFVGDNVLKVESPAGEVGKNVDVLLVFDDSRHLTYEKAFTYAEDATDQFNVDALVEGDKSKPASASATPQKAAPEAK